MVNTSHHALLLTVSSGCIRGQFTVCKERQQRWWPSCVTAQLESGSWRGKGVSHELQLQSTHLHSPFILWYWVVSFSVIISKWVQSACKCSQISIHSERCSNWFIASQTHSVQQTHCSLLLVGNVPLTAGYSSVALRAGDGALQPHWTPQPPRLQKVPRNEVVRVGDLTPKSDISPSDMLRLLIRFVLLWVSLVKTAPSPLF